MLKESFDEVIVKSIFLDGVITNEGAISIAFLVSSTALLMFWLTFKLFLQKKKKKKLK